MEKLFNKLKNISLNDAIKIEESDLQFFELKKLYNSIKNKEIFLWLIIANCIICYQLSSTWEAYWKEFSLYFGNIKKEINKNDIINELWVFIKNSKWNKRFIKTKINRLEKLKPFIDEFVWNERFYYENMQILQLKLANTMNQKATDKTIVFTVKMFSYWARIVFNEIIKFPFEISIPIDSRLKKIYEKFNENKNLRIDEFYNILAKKLNIPPLYLDAVLWVNFKNLIEI